MLTREQARRRLERGDVLRMAYGEGARLWWFEAPYAEVSDLVVRALIEPGPSGPAVSVMPLGDSLFGAPNASQSYVIVRGSA